MTQAPGAGRAAAPAAGPLRGEVRVPGDKSAAHRALLFGALCEGGLRARGLPDGEDVRSTRRCLEALGARVGDEGPGAVFIRGAEGGGPFRAPGAGLDCGNSGTTMRLLMGALCGRGFTAVLTGDASLSRRPMERVAAPLREMGAEVALTEGRAPVRVGGRGPLRPFRGRLETPSAQVKSAVLLAALRAEGESVLEDPFATRDHTERLLAWLGARLRREGARTFLAPGGLRAPGELEVAGDPSSAAYFLAAALLVPGSEVAVRGVCLNPTRLGFVEALRAMGARVEARSGPAGGPEPRGDLAARHSELSAADLPAAAVPGLVDEVPLLAVLASAARGTSRLRGLGELRHKESDRLEGTAAALRALGGRARVEGDDLVVEGPVRLRGGPVETLGDHRLAMSFAVAALAAAGEVHLSDAACAAISYPGFFRDLEALRA